MKTNICCFISTHDRHGTFEKNGVVFELHRKVRYPCYNDIEPFINRLYNSLEYGINDLVFSGLPTYENGLVMLGHIVHILKGQV